MGHEVERQVNRTIKEPKEIQDANHITTDHSSTICKALARSWWHGYGDTSRDDRREWWRR